jgi:hypothetical protein
MRLYIASIIALLAFLFGACGDDDQPPTPAGSTSPAGATLSPLEQKLASVVLQPGDLPEGLDAGSPDFATNEDLAQGDQAALQRLIDVGRQLGVDVQFIPTDRLDETNPLRGVQSSASVYTTGDGSTQTYRETADQARAVDWAKGYPELGDVQATEIHEDIADESLWIRVTGQLSCTFIVTPTPDAQGVVPSQTCEDTKLFVVDEIIFRSGRTRAYLKFTTLFPPDTPRDAYISPIKSWADLVTQRAVAAFPS